MVDAAGNLHDASSPQLWRQAQARGLACMAGRAVGLRSPTSL